MKKAIKITLVIVVVLSLVCWVLSIVIDINMDQVYSGKEKADFSQVGSAVQRLADENKLTPDVLQTIGNANALTELLAPLLERGKYWICDIRGNRYLVETRQEAELVFLTIRSTYVAPNRWYMQKQEVLGIEIAITKSNGKVTRIKNLWEND